MLHSLSALPRELFAIAFVRPAYKCSLYCRHTKCYRDSPHFWFRETLTSCAEITDCHSLT